MDSILDIIAKKLISEKSITDG